MVPVNQLINIIIFIDLTKLIHFREKRDYYFIQQHGASRDVINSGRVYRLLGFSTSPGDMDPQKSRPLREQPMFVNLQISNVLQVRLK